MMLKKPFNSKVSSLHVNPFERSTLYSNEVAEAKGLSSSTHFQYLYILDRGFNMYKFNITQFRASDKNPSSFKDIWVSPLKINTDYVNMDCADLQKIDKKYLVFFCNYKTLEEGHKPQVYDVIVRVDYQKADKELTGSGSKDTSKAVSYLSYLRDNHVPCISQNRVLFVPKIV